MKAMNSRQGIKPHIYVINHDPKPGDGPGALRDFSYRPSPYPLWHFSPFEIGPVSIRPSVGWELNFQREILAQRKKQGKKGSRSRSRRARKSSRKKGTGSNSHD